MSGTAVLTTESAARLHHLERQQRFLAREAAPLLRVIAWLDDDAPPAIPGAIVVHVPRGRHGLRVGAGRNAAVEAAIDAGAELLVLLDVDCLPGEALLERYRAAATEHRDALLCGPVTYLAEGELPERADALRGLTAPHAARPHPADGDLVPARDDEYDMFWSLSFALTPEAWRRSGGFAPEYEGYGAEDTDFAARARAAGMPLLWVGGAHAYHQWHPTQSPPVQHLDDILRNGAVFAGRWGRWPMGGWLEAFERMRLVERDGDGWRRAR